MARVTAHEELCAQRYDAIAASIDAVKATVCSILRVLAWGGSTIAAVMLCLVGFLAVRVLNANDAEQGRLRDHVMQLEQSGGASNRDVIRRADEGARAPAPAR